MFLSRLFGTLTTFFLLVDLSFLHNQASSYNTKPKNSYSNKLHLFWIHAQRWKKDYS